MLEILAASGAADAAAAGGELGLFAAAVVEPAMAALSGPPIALSGAFGLATALFADGTALEITGRGALDRASDPEDGALEARFAPWLAAMLARLAAVAATPPDLGPEDPDELVAPARGTALAAAELPPGLAGLNVAAAGFAAGVVACALVGLDALATGAAPVPAALEAGFAPIEPACPGVATTAFTAVWPALEPAAWAPDAAPPTTALPPARTAWDVTGPTFAAPTAELAAVDVVVAGTVVAGAAAFATSGAGAFAAAGAGSASQPSSSGISHDGFICAESLSASSGEKGRPSVPSALAFLTAIGAGSVSPAVLGPQR